MEHIFATGMETCVPWIISGRTSVKTLSEVNQWKVRSSFKSHHNPVQFCAIREMSVYDLNSSIRFELFRDYVHYLRDFDGDIVPVMHHRAPLAAAFLREYSLQLHGSQFRGLRPFERPRRTFPVDMHWFCSPLAPPYRNRPVQR